MAITNHSKDPVKAVFVDPIPWLMEPVNPVWEGMDCAYIVVRSTNPVLYWTGGTLPLAWSPNPRLALVGEQHWNALGGGGVEYIPPGDGRCVRILTDSTFTLVVPCWMWPK